MGLGEDWGSVGHSGGGPSLIPVPMKATQTGIVDQLIDPVPSSCNLLFFQAPVLYVLLRKHLVAPTLAPIHTVTPTSVTARGMWPMGSSAPNQLCDLRQASSPF